VDWIPASPLVQLGALTMVGVLVVGLVSRRYQRCPHCFRMVPRAHRGWRRCRGCGRQYHRSVRLRR
jgi:hypothetical protein